MDSSDSRSPLARARALWRVRRVFWLLVRRDLKVRYATSTLGYLWTILDPLLMSGVYWLLFVKIIQRDAGLDPYLVFLLGGMLAWQWFNGTVSEGGKALRRSGKLIRSTELPREIWVLRVVVSRGIEYVFSLPVLAVALIAYGVPVNPMILAIPLAMLVQTVLLSGIVLALAPLMVLVRDLDRLIPILLRLAFYSSPVLYSTARLPENWQWVYVVNPLSPLLSFYRSGFFPQLLNWGTLGISAASSVVIFCVGWFVFGRLERTVLKEI